MSNLETKKSIIMSDINAGDLSKVKKRGNFVLRQELSNFTIQCNLKVAIACNIILFLIMGIIGIPIYNSANNSIILVTNYTDWYIFVN